MIRFFIIFFIIFFSNKLLAYDTITGEVEYIRVHNISGAWEYPSFWFSLKNINSSNKCPKWKGLNIFAASSNHSLSLLMNAYNSGQEIAVGYNTSLTTHGYCNASYITLGNPVTTK